MSTTCRFRRLLGLIIVGCLAMPVLPAADGDAGSTIRGKVVEEDGKSPISGVTVHAYHLGTRQQYSSEPTDGGGRYLISGLPHGYVDLWVETTGGAFIGTQVVSVPPSGKVMAVLALRDTDDESDEWWNRRRRIPGVEQDPAGVAEMKQSLRGREFWRSPTGVAIIVSASTLGLLGIAAGGGDDPASPSQP